MELMTRTERTGGARLGDLPVGTATPDAFRFGLQTRTQVKYQVLIRNSLSFLSPWITLL